MSRMFFLSYLSRNIEPVLLDIANALAEFGDTVDNTSVYFESTIFWFNPIVAIFKQKKENNMDLPLTSNDIENPSLRYKIILLCHNATFATYDVIFKI